MVLATLVSSVILTTVVGMCISVCMVRCLQCTAYWMAECVTMGTLWTRMWMCVVMWIVEVFRRSIVEMVCVTAMRTVRIVLRIVERVRQ